MVTHVIRVDNEKIICAVFRNKKHRKYYKKRYSNTMRVVVQLVLDVRLLSLSNLVINVCLTAVNNVDVFFLSAFDYL